MAGGYFTDVVLHSSKNYHQEDATKLRLLSTDVAAARGAVISRFHGVIRCGISLNESLNLCVWLWCLESVVMWTQGSTD